MIGITIEEVRKAIEKYQKEHPLHSDMLDVTTISSKEGADIISQTIEKISKKVDEDTELWCICEMAKMYMQGIRPVYPVRQKGEWKKCEDNRFGTIWYRCPFCDEEPYYANNINTLHFCPNCGADMRGEENEKEET